MHGESAMLIHSPSSPIATGAVWKEGGTNTGVSCISKGEQRGKSNSYQFFHPVGGNKQCVSYTIDTVG